MCWTSNDKDEQKMHQPMLKKAFSIGEISYLNEYEVRGLIYEIFYLNAYLSDFLTLNPGSIILDVGANIGIFALFALKKCNEDAFVHCFEPIPSTFQYLENNLALYKDNVCLHNTGISNVLEDCYIDFTLFGNANTTATYRPMDKLISNYNPLLNYNTLLSIASIHNKKLYYKLKFLPFMRNYLIKKNYQKKTAETIVNCKLTSLGSFIENNKFTHIDFLKIDVEGSEVDVIKSIHPKQFPIIKQLSIEVHDIENRVERLANYLRKQGYIIKITRSHFFERLGFNQHMIHAKLASQK